MTRGRMAPLAPVGSARTGARPHAGVLATIRAARPRGRAGHGALTPAHASRSLRQTRACVDAPLFCERDLVRFGGVFDRMCVGPLGVALMRPRVGDAVLEGWAHIGSREP